MFLAKHMSIVYPTNYKYVLKSTFFISQKIKMKDEKHTDNVQKADTSTKHEPTNT